MNDTNPIKIYNGKPQENAIATTVKEERGIGRRRGGAKRFQRDNQRKGESKEVSCLREHQEALDQYVLHLESSVETTLLEKDRRNERSRRCREGTSRTALRRRELP